MKMDLDTRIERVQAAERQTKWRYIMVIAVAFIMYSLIFSGTFHYHWPLAVWPSVALFSALWQILRFRDIRVEKRILQQLKQNIANECKS